MSGISKIAVIAYLPAIQTFYKVTADQKL